LIHFYKRFSDCSVLHEHCPVSRRVSRVWSERACEAALQAEVM